MLVDIPAHCVEYAIRLGDEYAAIQERLNSQAHDLKTQQSIAREAKGCYAEYLKALEILGHCVVNAATRKRDAQGGGGD